MASYSDATCALHQGHKTQKCLQIMSKRCFHDNDNTLSLSYIPLIFK